MPSKTPEKPIMNGCASLQPHQQEFLQLAETIGIQIDHKVFSILVELLNMGVDANTVFTLLRTIRKSRILKSKSNH